MGRPKKNNSEKLLHRFDFMLTEKMVRNLKRLAKAKGITSSKVLQDYLEDNGGVSNDEFRIMELLTKLFEHIGEFGFSDIDQEAIRSEIKRFIFGTMQNYADKRKHPQGPERPV